MKTKTTLFAMLFLPLTVHAAGVTVEACASAVVTSGPAPAPAFDAGILSRSPEPATLTRIF